MNERQLKHLFPLGRRSLVREIATALLLLVTAASLVIGLTSYLLQKNYQTNLLATRADEYLSFLAKGLEWPVWTMDPNSIRLIAEAFITNELIETIEISDRGQTLIALNKTQTKPVLQRKGDILHNGQVIGTVTLGLSSRSTDALIDRLTLSSLLSLLVILLVLAVFTKVQLAYLLERPLSRFIKLIQTVARGDYRVDSDMPVHTELYEIFSEFKQMAVKVSGREEDLRQTALRLQEEIEARTRSERDREKLIGELEERNAELEQFTYTISHDLKSPLITIKGFLGYVRKAIDTGKLERAQADLARIGEAADRMNRLLMDLLELSRIGRIVAPSEAFSFTETALDVQRAMGPRLAEKNVRVVVDGGEVIIYGDKMRLREVIENLMENAMKFLGTQPQPLIEVGSREEEGNRVFFVRDNGIGIAPAYHQKIFHLFERLNPTIDGTGIGLAIVKRVIEVHGGRIWVESEGEGSGSTFCFTLPSPPATDVAPTPINP